MASNSSITLQSVIDYARSFGDLQPVLAVGGYSQQPALTIANDTMAAMCSPAINWKWNRTRIPPFYTNSLQQDYAVPGVVRAGWLEHGFIVDINNTATPPPLWPIETVRDLEATSWQWGRIGQVAWLPNDQLTYGTWQANATYTKILGTPGNPGTPLTQIVDPNGNFWAVSNNLNATVTTGSTQPTWPTSPTFPTYTNPTQAATTVTDGTVVWVAINPKGQGFRVNPLPPSSGLYYQINVIAQMRPVQFTATTQTLDPIPDDYANYFRQGFIAHAYRHSPDPKIQAKFKVEFELWTGAMATAVRQMDREKESNGIYPSESVMSSGYPIYPGPAYPFPVF
ncbi:MAG TPA: hypothetical protein VHU83_06660 [Bryobacteraceae bacterium]|jgi:hypothetical protein|nr:hypothetical protein [Bryobacteraceae bacterium]